MSNYFKDYYFDYMKHFKITPIVSFPTHSKTIFLGNEFKGFLPLGFESNTTTTERLERFVPIHNRYTLLQYCTMV